jgi:vacuolar-type H+-ATPase subunit I/STV1
MKDRKNQGRGLAKVSHLFLSGPEPLKEKVTIQVAAKTLGVSKGTIITYLNKGLLTRIKEGGRIYVSMDEVRTLGDSRRKPQVKPSVTTSAERNKRVSVNKRRDRSKRPSASFGLLESERQYLLTCKAALEAKDKELETLTFEVNTLKRNVKIQANELKGTETRLKELEKEQQKLLGELKKTIDANDHEKERTQARLLAVDDKVKRFRRPWWQELSGHLRLRPELSRKNGMVLLSFLALLTVLIFSGWWFNRSPKQPLSSVAERQPSGSEAVQAPSQALLDSELLSSSYPD